MYCPTSKSEYVRTAKRNNCQIDFFTPNSWKMTQSTQIITGTCKQIKHKNYAHTRKNFTSLCCSTTNAQFLPVMKSTQLKITFYELLFCRTRQRDFLLDLSLKKDTVALQCTEKNWWTYRLIMLVFPTPRSPITRTLNKNSFLSAEDS